MMLVRYCLGLGLVAGLWGSAAFALADRMDTRIYVAPMASYGFYDEDVDTDGRLLDIDDNFGGQISIGKPIFSFLNLELQAFYFDGVDVNGNSEVDILGYGVSALLFPFRDAFPIFGILGYNYGSYDFDAGEPNADIFDLGVGYAHEITDHGTAIRGEYRFRKADLEGGNGYGADFKDHVVSLGLQVPLGARPRAAPPPREFQRRPPQPQPRVQRAAPRAPAPVRAPAPAPVQIPAAPVDSDGDGVPDRRDQCPGTQLQVRVDSRGCPITANVPIILKDVTFDFDSARLTGNAHHRLDEVVRTLKGNRDIRVVAQGHTDNIGSPAYNKRLSQARAQSVKRYLVGKGIQSLRLRTDGYGEARPIAPNTRPDGSDNPEGRARNRRVELHVIE